MSDIKKQKIFVNKVIDITKTKKAEKKQIELYKELVHHRFFEVLSNANPIFNSLIKKKRFKKIVTNFIQSGARTDFIWQLPNEFRKFVKNNKNLFKDMDYVDDLLWFEWIEIKLFMKDYSRFKKSKFDTSYLYDISKSAKIKKLSYKVYEKEFTTVGEYCVLAYYDLNLEEVVYREISPFMYEFLKLIPKLSIKKSILQISKKYKLDSKELKAILMQPLKELCSLGVLVKKG
jgi:hypothetical protein